MGGSGTASAAAVEAGSAGARAWPWDRRGDAYLLRGGLPWRMLPLIRLAALDAVITPPWVLVGIGCALVTGLIAGLAPARRAARLQPAEALRFE